MTLAYSPEAYQLSSRFLLVKYEVEKKQKNIPVKSRFLLVSK